jgi:hypothetical protein
MRRFTTQVWFTMVIASGGAMAAISAEVPPPVLPAASGASAAGAPVTAPRVPQPPKPMDDPRPENAVIPQINVPLKRGEEKPALVKPGAQTKVSGGVDDTAARCLATSPARRAECGAAGGSAKASGMASQPSQ